MLSLRRLGVSDPEKSVITADGKRTPLFDALDLIDLKTELPKGEEQPG
jgi:hypothetical protein